MDGQSRIKFNPVTKEIEIEGSEKFVKTYFDKIQSLLSGTQKAIVKAPIKEKPIKGKAPERKPVKKVRQSKRAPKVIKEEKHVRKTKRGDMSKAVLALIQDSPEGIAMTELKEKTGLTDRQIWPIISVAKKRGKIKQVKRGVYIGA